MGIGVAIIVREKWALRQAETIVTQMTYQPIPLCTILPTNPNTNVLQRRNF
jgi:hypothetical protein